MKPKIKLPVIVEGKYDKIKITSLFDATVITTEGFGVFKNEKKREYIKRLCGNGVIIATDSDGAGALIRGHLKGVLPPDRVYNVYIPQISGREKRKKEDSAEGYLGVEGMDAETVKRLFEPFVTGDTAAKCVMTRAELYGYGLYGAPDSKAKRKKLCKAAGLPDNLSAKALCEALGRLYEKDELIKMISDIGE
jgi:ribonuclease M5